MYKQHSILAIIPARGGSKGLPGKNIMPLAGQPLINWTIQAGQRSSYIDRIIVSTDCQKTVDIAEMEGADVPFIRPSELAADVTVMEDVIAHCLQWLNSNETKRYDYLLLLQPTSPLRTEKDIDDAICKYFEKRHSDQTGLLSVVHVAPKYGWLMTLNDQRRIGFCIETNRSCARQELPNYFLPNGAIYFVPITEFAEHCLYLPQMLHHVMPENKSIDIDNIEDFQYAEKILQNKMIKIHIGSAV